MDKVDNLRGGRPPIEIDKEEFEKLCSILCTQQEIADWFKVSHDKIEDYCKTEYGLLFSVIYKKLSAAGKISLRRSQFQKAVEGNTTMLIWLGKQHLEQSDKQSIKVSEEEPFAFDDKDKDEALAILKKKLDK